MINIEYTNEDCMVGMARYGDKYFDLAIVDPPYGIGASRGGCGSRTRKYDRSNKNAWDDKPPDESYWLELFRVSKNQVVWGMNNYPLRPTQHFIVWDKKQPDGVTFAQAELAWTSFNGTSKIYSMSSNGQNNRIHPTQKPVALYKWLLKNYAKQGDKILDTHVGSASSLIACHDMGFDAVGFELDPDYYAASKQRLDDFMRQPRLETLIQEQ